MILVTQTAAVARLPPIRKLLAPDGGFGHRLCITTHPEYHGEESLMPMGIAVEDFPKFELAELRELLKVAEAMVTLTTIDSYRTEYAEVATLAKSELRRREVEAATTIQRAWVEKREREKNADEDLARLLAAKQRLTELGIDIGVDPKLVSSARLYHLATLIEAVDTISKKHKYLTTPAPRKAKQSALPGRDLQREFDTAKGALETAVEAIKKVYDDRKKAIELAARLAKTVIIPGKFKQEGALVDFGTFLYPGAGSVKYNNNKTYLLAPNRAMIHVKDDLPKGATPQLAGQYLQALVDGCVKFVEMKNWNNGEKHRVDGFLPSGRTFFWTMIGKAKASMQGYAGEIYHIDSGYANSRWHYE